MTMLIDKIRKMSRRLRILWGLGILIVVIVLATMINSFIFESDRTSGWITYSKKNSDIISDNAYAIDFDSSGRAWISTLKGVSVFDGESWENYSSNNSGLLDGWVRELVVDSHGMVWIGLGSGVNTFDGEHWTAYSASDSPLPKGQYMWAIAIDPSGRAWIGTSADGLRIYDGTNWNILREDNSGLANDYINAIAFDQTGRAWIGTNEGISVFDGQTWIYYHPGNSGISGKVIKDIVFDLQGKAWIGTRGHGVSVFDGVEWKNYTRDNPGGFQGDTVESIAIDSEGRALILSGNDLRVFDSEVWITYNSHNSGLANNGNRNVEIDPEGRIWITSSEGVSVATLDNTGLSQSNQEVEITQKESIYFVWRYLLKPGLSALAFLLGITWVIILIKGSITGKDIVLGFISGIAPIFVLLIFTYPFMGWLDGAPIGLFISLPLIVIGIILGLIVGIIISKRKIKVRRTIFIATACGGIIPVVCILLMFNL